MPFQFFASAQSEPEQEEEISFVSCHAYKPAFSSSILAERLPIGLFRRHLSDIKCHIANLPPSHSDAAIQANSDIIPRVYEGGLKTWEGAFDIIEYLKANISVQGLNVLELGCGSGLPGIQCLKNGASNVSFLDYNSEVLETTTYPNVLLNLTEIESTEEFFDVELQERQLNVEFYAGDWAGLPSLIPGRAFDLILSSETLYEAKTIPSLFKTMKACLSRTGRMYVSSTLWNDLMFVDWLRAKSTILGARAGFKC